MTQPADEIHFGQRVIQERKALGLNQEDLGAAAGVSKATVSKWERGDTKNMRPAHLFAIAKKLGVEARWLALGDGPRKMEAPRNILISGKHSELPARRLALIQAYGELPPEVRQPVRMLIETLYRLHHPAKADDVRSAPSEPGATYGRRTARK
jgi:transcriptional regulator with XRE-family HTH domain